MGFVQIQIIGNLGSDPEMRYTQNQKQVTTFNIAVNNSEPDGRGGWNESTDWFRCTVWGKPGERIVERMRKGNKIAVGGRFKTREFDGRDGQKRTSLDVTVDQWQDLSPRERDAEAYGDPNEPQVAAPAPVGNADISDLPF